MADTLFIAPSDLLIDEVNPRLAEPNVGQREARRALAAHQERKLQILARDIVEYGLSPMELPVVVPKEEGRYVVLEGNRRLGALMALENPDSLVDAIRPGVLKEIRKLSKRYHEAPIDLVQCLVVKTRDEIQHWLQLKHTGENVGAGLVRWGADEAARFKARTGMPAPHSQALDFLERRGDLTREARKELHTTTFQRVIEQPEVRSRLGLELRNRELFLLADQDRVAKALMWVINHLPPVTQLHTKQQRLAFADKLPPRIVVKPTIPEGQGIALTDTEAAVKPAKRTSAKRPRRRNRLIPSDCVLSITDPRVRAIEQELRRLDVEKYPNAVSVLMRVFIELSVDWYVDKFDLQMPTDPNLSKKLQGCAHDLVERKKLTQAQAKPVNRAFAADYFLNPSVKLMHEYVHGQYIFPAPGDLLAAWNSLQPFMTALWAV